jgi:hypothetical protein
VFDIISHMDNASFFNIRISPLKLGLGLSLAMGICIYAGSFLSESVTICWEIAFTFLLLFALLNSILSLTTKDQNNYWLQSLITYVLFAILGGALAWLVSGVGIDDVGAMRWMYMVFTFGYLILMTIIRSMRKIIEMAQRHDERMNSQDYTK